MINNKFKKLAFLTLTLLSTQLFSMYQENEQNNDLYNDFHVNINNNQLQGQNYYDNIFDAVKNNDIFAVQKFLNNGVNPNIINKEGNTPLHILCDLSKPSEEIAQILIDKNASLFIKNKKDKTPVNLIEDKRELESYFNDYDNIYDKILTIFNNNTNYINTLNLYKTINEKNIVETENLIINNKNLIYTKDENGNTPLHIAAQNKLIEIIRLILKTDSDTAIIQNNQGQTFYDLEILNENFSHLPDIKIFIENIKDGKHLLAAAIIGDLSKIKSICKNNNIDINAKDDDGATALHSACIGGHLDIIKYFCENTNIDINAKDNNLNTALHCACTDGYLDVIKYLCEKTNIDINAKNNNGATTLHVACTDGYLNVIKYLCENTNIDINAKDNDGDTALHYACSYRDFNTIKYLCENTNINIKATNNYNETAMDIASQINVNYPKPKIILYLIKKTETDITKIITDYNNNELYIIKLLNCYELFEMIINKIYTLTNEQLDNRQHHIETLQELLIENYDLLPYIIGNSNIDILKIISSNICNIDTKSMYDSKKDYFHNNSPANNSSKMYQFLIDTINYCKTKISDFTQTTDDTEKYTLFLRHFKNTAMTFYKLGNISSSRTRELILRESNRNENVSIIPEIAFKILSFGPKLKLSNLDKPAKNINNFTSDYYSAINNTNNNTIQNFNKNINFN